MATSPPAKDLPDISTENEGSSLIDSKTDSLPSSASADTGFVSDGTYDSPTSETDKDLVDPSEDDQSVAKDEELAEEDGSQLDVSKTDEDDKSKSNEVDEWIDILGNGQLKKKVIVSGQGVQSRPTNGDTVILKINANLHDENKTQVEDGEISFILNDGDVIVALDLAVALMEFGEKCELVTGPRYAYGDLGREPDIPKDSSLTFTLELIDVKPQSDISSLTFQERLRRGDSKRLRGNYLFGRGDYSGAINSYSKAVKVLDDTDLNAGLDESDRAQLEDAWTKCYNNAAACQLKIEAHDAAIRSAEKVLSSQSDNVKALYRLGKAYGAKGDLNKAISYLKTAIQLDPESKMLHQELFTLTKRKNKETESERDLYRKMLGVEPSSNKATSVKEEKKNGSNSMLRVALTVGGLAAVAASVGFAWYRNS